LVMMMDIRHLFTDFDSQMLEWCKHTGMPVHILLTKADKLGRGAAGNALLHVRQTLSKEFGVTRSHPWATVQLFSALKGTGVEEAHAKLDEWFGFDEVIG
jgi:GTP-binding protein